MQNTGSLRPDSLPQANINPQHAAATESSFGKSDERDDLRVVNAHSFGVTNVNDQATVIQGDFILIKKYYNGLDISEPEKKLNKLLESLAFDRINARVQNVRAALPKTCRWLFSYKSFLTWSEHTTDLGSRNGFLYIKGKPGSGKSTIMREALLWAKRNWNENLNLFYFFNARSPDFLERSTIGFYRSLLYQLLLGLPSLRSEFLKTFAYKNHGHDRGVYKWTTVEIQNFLIETLDNQALPPLAIFIDALDEGEEQDIRELVDFLEEFSIRASSAHVTLRICLSSRHWPFISIQEALSVIVEDQSAHNHDIDVYIHEKLHAHKKKYRANLRAEILRKSAGVFLWVVLVVPILNRIDDDGGSRQEIFAELSRIPPDLYELFTAILTKNKESLAECALVLQWVLYAMRPLSLEEVCCAIRRAKTFLDRETSLTSNMSLESYDYDDPETSEKLLLNRSRGLLELTKSTPPVVQFIHESVRGCLTDPAMAVRLSSTVQLFISHIFDFRLSTSSAVISRYCLKYLIFLCDSGERYAMRELLATNPLTEYAAKYWWQHAKFCNFAEQAEIVDLAIKLIAEHESWRDFWLQCFASGEAKNWESPEVASAVYCAAITGLPELVTEVLRLQPNTNARGGHCKTALQYASANGDTKIVRILLDAGADVSMVGGRFGSALQAACWQGHTEVAKLLVDAGANMDPPRGKYGSPLTAASTRGHREIFDILRNAGAQPQDAHWSLLDRAVSLRESKHNNDTSVPHYELVSQKTNQLSRRAI